MQDFGDYCSQMEEHQELTLKDIRDNNDYTIAKLKDGRCWMTQNLRIINTRVNNENSDIPSGNFDIPSSSRDFTRDYAAFYDSEYGGYYNYKVASANSPIMTGQIDRSICSKGWHIPSLSEWTTMLNFYNSYQALIQQPINLKFQTSMCGAQGTYCWVPQRHGYWWRSDSYDSTRAHTVYLMEGTGMNIPPYGSQNGKSCGFYIRCISD